MAPHRSGGSPLDNLTHALVGAAISKAGAQRATPLATATLVIAANAPDVDVLGYVRGEYFALSFRRGITHGWPALLVLPFVVAGVMLAWDRWVRLRRHPGAEPARAGPILALSAVGLVTHPTLDWMNTYGMRWWLPFDGGWSYGDALFIIDPWIWLALGGAVFLSSPRGGRPLFAWAAAAVAATALVVLAGGVGVALPWCLGLGGIVVVAKRRSLLERSEGGRAGARGVPPRAVAATVLCVAVYVIALLGADRAARTHVREAARTAGLVVEDVMVAPMPAQPLRSEVEVLTPEAIVPGSHTWTGTPRVELDLAAAVPLLDAPSGIASSHSRAIADAARRELPARDYLVWSRYPYVRIEPESDGWHVRFTDARYDGRPEAAGLAGVSVWVPDPEIR